MMIYYLNIKENNIVPTSTTYFFLQKFSHKSLNCLYYVYCFPHNQIIIQFLKSVKMKNLPRQKHILRKEIIATRTLLILKSV